MRQVLKGGAGGWDYVKFMPSTWGKHTNREKPSNRRYWDTGKKMYWK
jgi:hypothetical protein